MAPRVKACVTAVGPFSPAVMPHLEHPARCYEEVANGELITCRILKCLTEEEADRLAGVFKLKRGHAPSQQIRNPRDLADTDWFELHFTFDGGVSDFVALRRRGFVFFFTVDRKVS